MTALSDYGHYDLHHPVRPSKCFWFRYVWKADFGFSVRPELRGQLRRRGVNNFNAVCDLRHLAQHNAGRTVFIVR